MFGRRTTRAFGWANFVDAVPDGVREVHTVWCRGMSGGDGAVTRQGCGYSGGMASLRGQLLVSSVRLGDPNFARTVVLILAHDENGALGLVLNRPLDVRLARLSEEVLGAQTPREGVLYRGGPCEASVMVLFDDAAAPGEVEGVTVSPGLHFSGDRRVIESVLSSGLGQARFFAGYSGWGAGQLEGELEEEAWLLLPARAEHVLGPHDRLWELARAELMLGDRVRPEAIPQDPSMN